MGTSLHSVGAGPEVTPADFDPKRKGGTAINLWERAKATLTGQAVQARAAFFNSRLKHLFVRLHGLQVGTQHIC